MNPTAPAKLPRCTRSYLFKVDARCNAGKLQALDAMHAEWCRLLPLVGQHLWGKFLAGEVAGKSLSSAVGPDSVFGATPLVTSVKQCLAVAVEGQIKAWRGNLKLRITRLVMRSDRYASNEAVRHQLLWLNSMQLWLVPLAQQRQLLAESKGKTQVGAIDERCSRLLRRYVRAYIHRFKPPRFENLPLQVNQLSAVWAPAQSSTLPDVRYWLRISTLVRGARIELPIRENAYAAQFAGEQALTFCLIPKEGSWYVKVCKKLPKAEPRPAKGPVLGLDTGMVNLLSTSQGAIYGKDFNLQLRRWDERLQALTKGLQQAGEYKLSHCQRYRDFVRRMRGWLTSQIRCAVKRALALGQPSTVVIEALTFSSQPGVLSKKMNRLVRRMGVGVFKTALEHKAELLGFKLVEVNPAYTSQECGSCGFISRLNRKGNSFTCVCCGKQAHADAQASRNLVERFNQGRVCEYVKHTTLGTQGLEIWAKRMLARLKQATPGTSRHRGILGNARAGLAKLKEQDKLAPLNVLSELLIRISEELGSNSLNSGSTRYSG